MSSHPILLLYFAALAVTVFKLMELVVTPVMAWVSGGGVG